MKFLRNGDLSFFVTEQPQLSFTFKYLEVLQGEHGIKLTKRNIKNLLSFIRVNILISDGDVHTFLFKGLALKFETFSCCSISIFVFSCSQ